MQNQMRLLIFMAIVGLTTMSCRAQSDIDDIFRPRMPEQIDTIYYPFYNGVQMIEVDHLAYWDRKIFFLEQSQPRAMSYSMLEPPPPPNEYFFRDSTGAIIKAYNTFWSLGSLNALFKDVPLDKKSNNFIHQFIPTHAGKVAFSDGVWPYSPQPMNFFNGFYKVYNLINIDTSVKVNSYFQGNNNPYGNCKSGLIDSLGNLVIPMKYDALYPLKNNLLARLNGKWGVMNKEQKEIIPMEYDSYVWESQELISFSKNDKVKKHYRIDKSTVQDIGDYDEIINPEYIHQYPVTMMKKDGRIGFIDSSYTEVVAPVYEMCESFYASDLKLARVFRDGKWGYINKQGKEVIPCQFEDSENFGRDDYALVQFKDEKFCIDTLGNRIQSCDHVVQWQKTNGNIVSRGYVYGLVNNEGIVVLPVIYDQLYKMPNEDFYRISRNKLIGLADKSGKIILPCKYEEIGHFWKDKNIALIRRDTMYGVIDSNFQIIIPYEYELIQGDLTGNLIFKKNGLFGLMDLNTTILIPALYQQFNGFRQIMYTRDPNPYAMVMRDSLYGYINLKGKEVIPCKYKHLGYEIHNNRVFYQENNKYGFLDTTGKVVVAPVYDRVYNFIIDVTAVQQGEKWALINEKGKLITEFDYDLIVGHTWYDQQFVVVYQNKKCGVIDKKGKTVLPVEYEAIHEFSQATGLKPEFRVTKNGSTYWESTK
ncbi:MAG: WG repeat-containing protein [Bacteroidales bacterium]